MPVIINIPTGNVSRTYPPEYEDEINLYKDRGFEELYAAFRILDAVYNYEKKYNVEIRPYWAWGNVSRITWGYRITSPLIKQEIHIKEYTKDLTPNIPTKELNPSHEYGIEYQINIGNLFEMSTGNGVFAYLCRLFAEPAKQKYFAESRNFPELERIRKADLIALAKNISILRH